MAILTPREVLACIVAAYALKDGASDADASKCIAIYPELTGSGELIKAGTRVSFRGTLYRSRVDLWDTIGNIPENNPNAWERIMYKDGYRVIEDEITSENPIVKGERIWFRDKLYESTYIGANVWTPERYPDGYQLITSR